VLGARFHTRRDAATPVGVVDKSSAPDAAGTRNTVTR
jgi:hypothetical protein